MVLCGRAAANAGSVVTPLAIKGNNGGGRDALDDKAARGWMASARRINKHRWGATRKAASLDYEVVNRG